MQSMGAVNAKRQKLAQLTSGVGELVLGIGIGVMAAPYLGRLGVLVVVLGGVLHLWGMFDIHRLEVSGSARQPWWAAALYWLCWAALAVLGVYLLARVIGT